MAAEPSDVREAELVARLDDVTRERNLYAKTLAEANRLYEEKVKELNALRRVGDALRSVLSVRKVCGEIVDVLVEEVGAENCSLMLLDRKEGTLLLKAARGKRDSAARYFESDEPETRFKLGEGVAGWVAQNARPVLIPDTSQDERFKRAEAGGLDIRSLLCIPLVEGTQVWGVLNLSHSDINAFTEDNERILTIIAGQAGIALANLGLFKQLQDINEALEETVAARTAEVRRQAGRIAVINRIAKVINSVIDPEQVLGVIVDEVRKLVVFDRAAIASLDETNGTLRVTTLDLEHGSRASVRDAALRDGLVARSLHEGRVLSFGPDEAAAMVEVIDVPGLASGVVVPLLFQEKARGALILGSPRPDGFTPESRTMLGELAEHIAVAVEKSRLYHEVRKMNEELEEMVADRTRELTESESRYRALFEKSAEAVFLMDESGRIVNANDRWTELSGRSSAAGATLALAAPDGTSLTLAAWAAKAARAELVVPELALVRDDGLRRIVELRLNPVEVVGQRAVLGVAHDITRRKGLEEQLLRSEKLAAMGTLAASVAHEINNPLEGIKNCINLLKNRAPSDARNQEILELVEKGFTRIRDIVRQVLDFHRPSSKEAGPIDLHEALNGLLPLFRNDFKNRNVRLELDLAPDLPLVRGNRSQFEQVFTNVILNAEDAMESGGTLSISTRRDAGEVVVSFADTGHGITKDDLQHVLQPFFTRKRSGKGTGLGLWISHSVVKEHSGRLDIASVVGKGTTVSIVLPALATPL